MAAPEPEIDFYHSESDLAPIPKQPNDGLTSQSRSLRKIDPTRMNAILEAERESGDASPPSGRKRANTNTTKPKRKSKKKKNTLVDDEDADDDDFEGDADDSEDSDLDSNMDVDDIQIITNKEIAAMLPAKTYPRNKRPAASSKSKTSASVEDVEDDDEPPKAPAPLHGGIIKAIEPEASPVTVTQPSMEPSKKSMTKNPIYLFYELVPRGADGSEGERGTKHYKCYHGARKIITIKPSMKSNTMTLVNNLKSASPPMHKFFDFLKARSIQPSSEETALAAKQDFDPAKLKSFIASLNGASENIRAALERQAQASLQPFEYKEFERLLVEWIIACDQPFDEVEKPEFQRLMEYTAHRPGFELPSRETVRRRVMQMGTDTVDDIRRMFKEDVEGKISLSLDAWTSSNNYAFLAIVAHYVNKRGQLEEHLIDFKELVGEHSGENMADAVWETIKMYDLEGRILAIMLDNASNNDTLLSGLARRSIQENVFFNADWAHLRYLPHTIHLSALKLLEAIGVLSSAEANKAASRSGNYQDCTNTGLDINIASQVDSTIDEDGNEMPLLLTPDAEAIMPAVDKLRKIVCAVRASPQRKQAWFQLLDSRPKIAGKEPEPALVLILDVKTRWSSMHQMFERALIFASEINNFVACNRELRSLELDDQEWEAIKQVTTWLMAFRAATLDMSQTKQPMLSTTHTIFKGLQEHLQGIIDSLSDTVPSNLRRGLIDAHLKLSDYYGRSDKSPFYTCAAILDPRIMYKGLEEDYTGDTDLLNHLKSTKTQLCEFYERHYAPRSTAPLIVSSEPSTSSARSVQIPKMSFTARYQKKDRATINELEEYFKYPSEDFETCNPLEWWRGRRSQFPNLYRLACDILAIPGSAVAVEHVFSGGRDTISLRRASLKPKTIRTLMLVKQRLRLDRQKLEQRDTC